MKLLSLRRPRDKNRTPRRGQAMVEFAMVLPIIALLLVMALDFGRVFFGWVALQNATRIAADFAASNADAFPSNAATLARYQAVVLGDLGAISCLPADGSWDSGDAPAPTFPDGKDTGDRAVVQIECGFGLITPLAESILGGSVPVAAAATFPVNKTIQQGLPPDTTPDPPPPGEEDPDPDPDPDECLVPNFTSQGGTRTGAARTAWGAAGFVPVNLTVTPPDNNYKIKSQTIPPGSQRPCSATTMTVDD